MDKQSGSSSKSAQKAVDLSSLSLTDKRPCSSKKEAVNPSPLTDEKLCAYCGKIGDLKLKCEFCEQKSLPATYYCSVACKMDHRHDAQNPHICGAVRPALTDDEKLCAYCQKKKGIQKCEMCERMSCPPTLYCSDVCQKTDWSFHKHICGKSKLCPHCGKKAICTYLCNGLCGLSYCSFRCLMDDIKCHRHICGVSYPAKADPKNGIV
jgi:hypothetical protein